MGKTGWIAIFDREVLREKIFTTELEKTAAAFERRDARQSLQVLVRDIGKNGDLDLILAVERRFLENELAEYANSREMRTSLETALAGLAATERLVAKVRDPARYREIDEAHSLPRNRKGGVPWDEARQFFASHDTRLTNLDRSRLSAEEKDLLDARKANFRAAAKVYTALQRQALGLAPGPGAAQSLGR